MGFTFYARDDVSRVREVLFDQNVNVSETGDQSDREKHEGEGVARLQFPVQIDPEEQAAENHHDHGDADAAGIGQLNGRPSSFPIHFRRAS